MLKWVEGLLENETVYRTWQATHADSKFEPIRRHNDLSRVRRVLDVGCGPGTNTRQFADVPGYLGLDINPRYTEYARKRFARDFVTADVTRFMPPEDERFDFILLNSFLHHVDDEGVEAILSRLPMLLAEGGHVHVLEIALPERPSLARLLARSDRGRFIRPLSVWRTFFHRHFRSILDEEYKLTALGVTTWNMVYFKGGPLA